MLFRATNARRRARGCQRRARRAWRESARRGAPTDRRHRGEPPLHAEALESSANILRRAAQSIRDRSDACARLPSYFLRRLSHYPDSTAAASPSAVPPRATVRLKSITLLHHHSRRRRWRRARRRARRRRAGAPPPAARKRARSDPPGGPTTNTPPRHRPETTDARVGAGARDGGRGAARDLASVGEAWGFGQFPAAVDRSKGPLLDASSRRRGGARRRPGCAASLSSCSSRCSPQSALVDRYRGARSVARRAVRDMGARRQSADPPPQRSARA